MTTLLNLLFKSMQRDDKKEIVKFQVDGNTYPEATLKLFELAGTIVVFQAPGLTDEMTAEFLNIQRDSKKTVIKFALKSDSVEQANKLYQHAGNTVPLIVRPSQMTVEEFYGDDDEEGLAYKVNGDGTVEVDSNQVSIDELVEGHTEDDLPGLELDDEETEDSPLTFLDEE